MKKVALIIIVTTLFAACNKDFKITTEWEEQMIVYGLIDVRSPVQYLKITKAFLGDDKIIKYSENPDSSQYNTPLDVKMYELDENGNILQTFTFDTIHIHTKDSGLFYSPTQIAYKSRPYDPFYIEEIYPQNDTIYDTACLNPNHKYRLEVKNTKSGMSITSETNLADFSFFEKPSYYSALLPFSIFDNTSGYNFEWTNGNHSNIAQFKLYFEYGEKKYGSIDTIYKKIKITDDVIVGKSEYKVLSDVFLSTCDKLIKYDDSELEDSIEKRFIGNCLLELHIGNEVLYKYMMVNKPSSGLIQDKPIYTNIHDGIGIFGSRTKINYKGTLVGAIVTALKDDLNLNF